MFQENFCFVLVNLRNILGNVPEQHFIPNPYGKNWAHKNPRDSHLRYPQKILFEMIHMLLLMKVIMMV